MGLLLGGVAACQEPAQVESHRLQQLEATMQALNSRLSKDADKHIANIERGVSQNREQRRDVEVLRQAEEVREQANALVGYLQHIRQRLGTPEPAIDSRLADAAPVTALLLDGGAADTLQHRLNNYAAFIRPYVPEVAPLALDAEQDPNVTQAMGSALKDWRFAQLYFQGASVASALAMLSQKELEVRDLERTALRKLSERVGSHSSVFFKIGAMATPESRAVRAGEVYRAYLYLTSTQFSVYRQTGQVNGHPVNVGPDGRVQVSFLVPTDAPDGPALWDGKISGRYEGRDTTFRIRVPYTIQRN
ncbi:hypothetical protein GCM10023186_32770 [Hymenobacter koreensis]|uniref:Gliding motility-associated protein GldM N-terminal domain-containing protein n=2 Tax=Hymenobacter koreensis TaxID=1084523 RepID=A0ABP8J9D2_9BACT